jgi:acyl-[acyl-carrier-protein]-phospholipid O-acyltransferase/long-chain-fatty-acid--[acyl-carrier-protein] ligase
MIGYLGDHARTASVLHEGFSITGDIGYLDADGFLFVVDRLSRFSKVAGEMVPDVKIEETVRELFTDADCFLTGVVDDR